MSNPKTSPPLPTPEILVLGAGVLALTTATHIQKTHPNTPITLIAAEFSTPSPMAQSSSLPSSTDSALKASPSYASMWAGAHYRPIPFVPRTHPTFADLDPAQQQFHLQLAREQTWAFKTAKRMMGLARRDPTVGVEIVEGEEILEGEPPVQNSLLRSGDRYAFESDEQGEGDGFRVWNEQELEAVNAKWAASYTTYVVNPHVYTGYLLDQFRQRGGRTIRRRLCGFQDALDSFAGHRRTRIGTSRLPAIVMINCTGTGLPQDPHTTLIRGQTVLLRRAYHKTVTRQCADGSWSFLIPRPLGGGTIVGGTKQVGDVDGKARPEERRRLLENARRCFPEFMGQGSDVDDEQDVVCDNVGFRPGRVGGVRVEREDVELMVGESETVSVSIVHGYGAGGRGYEISWGVAEEVCGLVEACLNGRGRSQLESSRL